MNPFIQGFLNYLIFREDALIEDALIAEHIDTIILQLNKNLEILIMLDYYTKLICLIFIANFFVLILKLIQLRNLKKIINQNNNISLNKEDQIINQTNNINKAIKARKNENESS